MAAGLNLLPQTVNGLLTLDLSNQGLTSIPEEVFDITDLEDLDVSDNNLTSIPEAIGRLQKLYRLDAYSNMLTRLPQAIGSLQKLTHLYIYDNQLTEMPSGVCSLPNLEVLSVGNNKLSTFPPGVEKLQKLRELYINGNQLTEVPSGVCSLPNLEVLGVSNNNLSTFPPGVEKLQKLRELYIYGNQLTEVPSGVCSLPNLEVLGVSNNNLSTFPPGVEKLQKLRELYIYGNQLTEVPSGVCSLPNLEVLSVSNNKLSTFPPGVEKLQKLRELYIYDNQLTEVPTGVCSLPDLEWLSVGNNPIRRLPRQVLQLKTLEKLYAGDCKFDMVPDEVGNLQHLWFLALEYNLLKTLPSTMRHLHNLREVRLWSNKFDTFPEVLCELPAMEKLVIRNNNITRLPTALHRADKLKDLDVSGNPLTYPPQDVCEQGTGAIMAFLKQEAEKTSRKSDIMEAAAETELERKLRERREKSARMEQQVSQQTDQTAERMDTSKGAAPLPPQAAGTKARTGVARKQPPTLKLTGGDTAQDKDLNLAFSRLALKVKQAVEWKHIARQLGFNNQEVKDVETDCPDEPMYETLVRWRERAGPAASLAVLERCLRDLDLHQLADQISRTAMSPTRRGQQSEESGAVGGQLPGGVQRRYPSVTIDKKLPIIEFEHLNFPEKSFLGRGGFAAVEKAYHLDWRRHVAVKRLLTHQITGSEQELLYSEARKLNLGSRSDHVISLLGVCLDPNFAIVMPYMENGSLAGLLRDVDVPWALRWRMAHEISLGMTFLHCQNPQILHCDLKAENVLLDEDFHVKISDFGLSKWRTESGVVTSASPTGGTLTHIPPECLLVDINTRIIPNATFDVYRWAPTQFLLSKTSR
uniref:Leucine-rich repeat protein SHOC-2 n=1 Tax=Branchiostoma floridae TaxID=7739 RepID=C3ZPZ1_BRAFL|eukprot:XP_002589359.1 hypothetical protein BRAFLDRAFT_77808 [Branchiostoma floridae]